MEGGCLQVSTCVEGGRLQVSTCMEGGCLQVQSWGVNDKMVALVPSLELVKITTPRLDRSHSAGLQWLQSIGNTRAHTEICRFACRRLGCRRSSLLKAIIAKTIPLKTEIVILAFHGIVTDSILRVK